MDPEKARKLKEKYINRYYNEMYGKDFAEVGKALNRLKKILRSADD